MSKKKEVAKNQVDLMTGKKIKIEQDEEKLEDSKYIQISALQKYIRRGEVEKAMHNAYKLSSKKSGWHLWKRLNVIAVEDVLNQLIPVVVSELGRQVIRYGYDTWDGKRCAVAATKLMAECPKDRSADEFLGMEDFIEKNPDDEVAKEKLNQLDVIEDYVLDMHTRQGQRMGRGQGFKGDKFWYETSSQVENPSVNYKNFNKWVWEQKKRIEKEKEDGEKR